MKNILILNSGTRDVLIRDFINTAQGRCKIVVTDNYELAPALYESPFHYVTKRWDEHGYWDEIETICKKEDIGLVLSLIDPELELLAMEKPRFDRLGILTNIAAPEAIKATYDKYQTMEFLRREGFHCIPSYNDFNSVASDLAKGIISFPLISKPRKGSGSARIEIVSSLKRLKELCDLHDDVIIQEFIDGQEIGADVYVDLISGDVVSIFTKKKLKMRAGETDKSVSFLDSKLFALLSDFSVRFGLKGTNDIDVFEKNGVYYISEVNPRFGGGYIHAYACGVDFPSYLINNMNGIPNKPEIGSYKSDLYMMKYFDITIAEKISCNSFRIL